MLELLEILSDAILIAFAVLVMIVWALALLAIYLETTRPYLVRWLEARNNVQFANRLFKKIEDFRNDFA